MVLPYFEYTDADTSHLKGITTDLLPSPQNFNSFIAKLQPRNDQTARVDILREIGQKIQYPKTRALSNKIKT